MKSIFTEPENDFTQLSYESWKEEPQWLNSYYAISAVFQKDIAPFPTVELSFKILNNVDKDFKGDTFTIVFYQVEIEKLWESPTQDSDF